MNKNDFLNELRHSIRMLDDSEQTDIIDEYSQHIDMKVESGMTEAEAIADFGPLDELIEEILAAYHVKPLENDPAPASAPAENALLDSGKQLMGAAVGATKQGCAKLKESVSSAFAGVKEGARKSAETAPVADPTPVVEPVVKKKSKIGAALSGAAAGTAKGASNLWGMCVSIVKTCLRWCWNAFVVIVALCSFAGAACALFAFGVCIVLLFQGYPLFGVTLALFGTIAFCASFALLALRSLWLKKSDLQKESAVSGADASASQVFAAPANEVM